MSKQDAFEAGRKFAAQFPGFLDACRELGEIGNLEEAKRNAVAEYEAAVATRAAFKAECEQEIADYQQRLTDLAADAARLKEDANEQITRAQREAEEIVNLGKMRAEAVAAAANKDASQILADAHQIGSQVVAKAKAEAEAASGGLADVTKQLAAKKDDLAALNDKIAEAQGRKAAIEAHIAQLKAM